MSKGYSGMFHGTKGNPLKMQSSFLNNSTGNTEEKQSFAGRNIEIPRHIKDNIEKLDTKGKYLIGNASDFSMNDVSVMSKETGLEFAKLNIDGKTYLVRGGKKGVVIPDSLSKKLQQSGGIMEFHSHPYNDDCVPSAADREVMKMLREITGQKDSKIVTPNGRVTTFDEHGVKDVGIVSNKIDKARKQALIELFGGDYHD